jgi:hypothetical protein
MAAHIIFEPKRSLESYVRKVVEFFWDLVLVLTLGFGLELTFLVLFALAINFHIIHAPKQYCHDVAESQATQVVCK